MSHCYSRISVLFLDIISEENMGFSNMFAEMGMYLFGVILFVLAFIYSLGLLSGFILDQ